VPVVTTATKIHVAVTGGSDGSSSSSVAGIVVGCMIGVTVCIVAIILIILLWYRRQKIRKLNIPSPGINTSFFYMYVCDIAGSLVIYGLQNREFESGPLSDSSHQYSTVDYPKQSEIKVVVDHTTIVMLALYRPLNHQSMIILLIQVAVPIIHLLNI